MKNRKGIWRKRIRFLCGMVLAVIWICGCEAEQNAVEGERDIAPLQSKEESIGKEPQEVEKLTVGEKPQEVEELAVGEKPQEMEEDVVVAETATTDWKDTVLPMVEQKQYPQAISFLSQIEDDAQAQALEEQLRYIISGDYISNPAIFTIVAAIGTDGRIKVAGTPEGLPELKEACEWEDVKCLCGNGAELIGMDSYGTCKVDPMTENKYELIKRDSAYTRLQEWEPVRQAKAISSLYAVITADGGVDAYDLYDGSFEAEAIKDEIAGWKDIVDIAPSGGALAALHGNGKVSLADTHRLSPYDPLAGRYQQVEEWTDIVDIEANLDCIAGLKADGTVVVSKPGWYYYEATKWTDIIAISLSHKSLLGLKRDGTVVVAGENSEEQNKVQEWTDIVAIAAGQEIHMGLRQDGTVVLAGQGSELIDVSGLSELWVPGQDMEY